MISRSASLAKADGAHGFNVGLNVDRDGKYQGGSLSYSHSSEGIGLHGQPATSTLKTGLNFNQKGLSGVDVTYGRTTEYKSGGTTYNSGLTGGLGYNIQKQTTDLIVGASASMGGLGHGFNRSGTDMTSRFTYDKYGDYILKDAKAVGEKESATSFLSKLWNSIENTGRYMIGLGDDTHGYLDSNGEFRFRTCFVAGTKVKTDHGFLPIEQIKPGMRVLAWNEKTGQLTYSLVQQTFVRTANEIYRVKYDDGSVIETTWSHPFYIAGKGWVKGKDLQPGMKSPTAKAIAEHNQRIAMSGGYKLPVKMVSFQNDLTGKSEASVLLSEDLPGAMTIEAVETLPGKETVYNFSVEDAHSYFVGEDGVLVHNQPYAFTVLGDAIFDTILKRSDPLVYAQIIRSVMSQFPPATDTVAAIQRATGNPAALSNAPGGAGWWCVAATDYALLNLQGAEGIESDFVTYMERGMKEGYILMGGGGIADPAKLAEQYHVEKIAQPGTKGADRVTDWNKVGEFLLQHPDVNAIGVYMPLARDSGVEHAVTIFRVGNTYRVLDTSGFGGNGTSFDPFRPNESALANNSFFKGVSNTWTFIPQEKK